MDKDDEPQPSASAEQVAYARGLKIGVTLALVALVATFAAYVSGLLPSAVPVDKLPQLWSLPVAEYVARTGVPQGWGWVSKLRFGDMLSLASIAFLISISTWCLLLLPYRYLLRRDWIYLVITVLEVGIIMIAASGLFVGVR
jgi:hypothetical protein